MKNMKRSVALLVAIALLIGCAAGGTMAWLTMKTAPVVNTFTTSDINITLDEGAGLDLKMVPGKTITKDPKVTVLKDSEDSYLFVEITESENFKDFMTYEIAEGWTLLEGTKNVYVREVTKSDKAQEFYVLKEENDYFWSLTPYNNSSFITNINNPIMLKQMQYRIGLVKDKSARRILEEVLFDSLTIKPYCEFNGNAKKDNSDNPSLEFITKMIHEYYKPLL